MAKLVNKIIWYFLAVGFFVPCLLQTLLYLRIIPIDRMPDLLLFALWPALGFYMASDTGNGADAGRAAVGFLMSIVVNALLYGSVGALVSFFYRRFSKRSAVNSF